MLQFENTTYLLALLALIPLVLLFRYVLVWKQKAMQRLGNPQLIRQLTRNYSHKNYTSKIIITFIAIVLLIISAANLRKPLTEAGTATNGIDIMLVLDVSNSMLSEDEKPTRLDKAKQFIYNLTQQLPGNRIGLIVFAGQAYLQMPLTPDVNATRMFVSNASPALVGVQGTNISDALQLADASLDTKDAKHKAIIVITDGEDHEGKAIEKVKTLAEHGAIVHTIGIGSEEGVPITELGTNSYKRAINGETVISKLNVDLLQQLAAAGNGTYHLLNNTNAVATDLAVTLNAMETKTIGAQGGYVAYQSFYPFFLGCGIVLLIVEVLISERKKLAA